MHTPNYWNSTPLDQLSRDEWELLCDGCGKCCLHKLQDDETDEVFYTRVITSERHNNDNVIMIFASTASLDRYLAR